MRSRCEEEVETQIQKPAGDGGSANTQRRGQTATAHEYSTMTGLVALSGGPVGGWEQGACAAAGPGEDSASGNSTLVMLVVKLVEL